MLSVPARPRGGRLMEITVLRRHWHLDCLGLPWQVIRCGGEQNKGGGDWLEEAKNEVWKVDFLFFFFLFLINEAWEIGETDPYFSPLPKGDKHSSSTHLATKIDLFIWRACSCSSRPGFFLKKNKKKIEKTQWLFLLFLKCVCVQVKLHVEYK